MIWLILFASIILSTDASPVMTKLRRAPDTADVKNSIIRDFTPQVMVARRKPPCGASPSPGEDCERVRVTVCEPVAGRDRNAGQGSLHDRPKTTCVEVKPMLRVREGYYHMTRQMATTTSTFPPLVFGTAATTDRNIGEVGDCKNVANCRVFNW